MKNKITYLIIAILLLIIIAAGSAYAFFSVSAKANNNLEATGKKFEVIYTGGSHISGTLEMVSKREEGLNTTVNIRMAKNSANAIGKIYINVEKITSNISVEGFIWEVVGIKNGDQVYYKKGNFKGINDTDNNIVTLVENYLLTEDNTAFTIYLWVDGNKVDNDILNSEFQGYIGAKTENFTGITN